MPEGDPEARDRIAAGGRAETVGELTFVLYRAILGALEATRAEFYRRHIGPYTV